MICYVTACTTQHTENKKMIQFKLYKAAKGRKPIQYFFTFLIGSFSFDKPRRCFISRITAALRRWPSFFNVSFLSLTHQNCAFKMFHGLFVL